MSLDCRLYFVILTRDMKMRAFILSLAGLALSLGLVSCSQNSGMYADAETAKAVADGTMPPWMAEYSDPVYETGSYTPASADPYAYNPPAKPKSSAKKPTSSASTKKKPTTRKTPTTVSHKVKKGDTLGGLASKYRTSVKAIKSENGLKSDMIRIGQTLRIPRGKK